MAKKKATRAAQRIHRKLTADEARRVADVRRRIQAELPELMQKGRTVFAAHEAARRVIADLKAQRQRQGISLTDVMSRSGINREAISKLENSEAPNPTVRTLVRYAAAVGLELRLTTEPPSVQ